MSEFALWFLGGHQFIKTPCIFVKILIVCFTDFCYFVNLSVALQTAFFPEHLLWYKVSIKTNISRQCDWNLNNIFKANYMLAMGPLMTAIMVWKNSLVFHSLDKLTSMYSDAPLQCLETDLWLINVDYFWQFASRFLHAFPPLTVHLFRWGLIQNKHIR